MFFKHRFFWFHFHFIHSLKNRGVNCCEKNVSCIAFSLKEISLNHTLQTKFLTIFGTAREEVIAHSVCSQSIKYFHNGLNQLTWTNFFDTFSYYFSHLIWISDLKKILVDNSGSSTLNTKVNQFDLTDPIEEDNLTCSRSGWHSLGGSMSKWITAQHDEILEMGV